MMDAHNRFPEQVEAARREDRVGGDALQPTTPRRAYQAATLVTDGPFAETKEALGGYYLIEAKDLDQALEVGKLCPAEFGGVEVRPIMVFE